MIHPPTQLLQLWLDGLLSESDSGAIESHVEACVEVCRPLLKRLSSPAKSEPPSPPTDKTPGTAFLPNVLGFEVLSVLGRGGMAVVYRARDEVLNRPVAVKVLRAEFASSPDLVRRFREEAQIASQLQHPAIPSVYELGNLPDGRPYFAMKLVEGRDLATLLEERPLPSHDLSRFLTIFQQVCQTVAYAQSKGVLHRDLKPLNVMVGAFGEVQVMDWGLGKVLADREVPAVDFPGSMQPAGTIQTVRTGLPRWATDPGRIAGTLAYMPPEQARGEVADLDVKCDVFSLGAILCEILTGQPPYLGPTKDDFLEQARAGRLEPAFGRLESSGADAQLLVLAKSCLSAARETRLQNAGAVADGITRYLNAVQQKLREAEIERARAEAAAAVERKKRRWQVGLAVSILLLLTASTAAGLWYTFDKERRADAERRDRLSQESDVAAALDLFDKHLRADHKSEARSALERAEGRAMSRPTDTLEDHIRQARLDFTTLENIEGIRLRLSELYAGKADYRAADRDFSSCYAAYGISLDPRDRARAVARIGESPIREHLIAGLDVWASVRARSAKSASFPIEVLAQAADDNQQRKAFRTWAALGLTQWLTRNYRNLDNASTVWLVGSTLSRAGSRREAIQLLRAGQQRHHDDFWLNFELGTQLVVAQPTSGAVAEGIGYLRAAVALRPESPLVAVNLAKALADLGHDQEALDWLQQAIGKDALLAVAHAARGGLLARQYQFPAALDAVRRAISIDPHSAFCQAQAGYVLVAINHVVEGMACLDKALRLDSSSAEVRTLRGTAFVLRQLPRRGIPEFLQATQLNPASTEAWGGLAIAKADSGDLAGAVQAGERAVALNAEAPVAQLGLGYALELFGKDVAAAAHFDLAATAGPAIRLQQGLAFFRRHQPKDALLCFREVERACPSYALIHSMIGYALAEQGRTLEAFVACRRAIKLDPQSPIAHCNLGYLLIKQEDYQEGVKESQAALALDPECVPALCNLGCALGNLKRFREAEEVCKKAAALDPQLPEAFTNLGLVYIFSGRNAEAISALETAGKLMKSNLPRPREDLAAQQTNLAGAYLAQLRYDEALKAVRAAIAIDDTYYRAQYAAGVVLTEKGNYAEALKPLKRAVQLNPLDAGTLSVLARAYFGAGERSQADECLRRAMLLVGYDVDTRVFVAIEADEMGKFNEAITVLRPAIEDERSFGIAHGMMARVLSRSGHLAELLTFYKASQKRFTSDASLATQVAKTERLVELEKRLPAVLSGNVKPASPREMLDFADICVWGTNRYYFEATRLYTQATQAAPDLLETSEPFTRYDAACASLMAAQGAGCDASTLDAKVRGELRSQAFRWVTTELLKCKKQLARADAATIARLRKRLDHWKSDSDLASVRDPGLLKLPEAERKGWQQFWVDVDALLRKLGPPPQESIFK